MSESAQESETAGPRVFATTHWSVVLAAGQVDASLARRALETLCQAYWYPIYVYVRRKGHGPDHAQDLTQEFFAQLIAKEQLRLADREKGKFRTFLLATLDYFLAREWSRAHRQKRGGQYRFISLDQQMPEERYRLEPADNDTAEKKFQRQWALTVLKQAMKGLERECEANGKGALFREVRGLLAGERDGAVYAEIGRRLGMSEGAVRVAVHRLRRRYGELLRGEIAQTVSGPEEVDEEMRYLLYRRANHKNLHVRGYKEEGTTSTPFDMVVMNDLDRFHLLADVIDRVPQLGPKAAYAKQAIRDKLIEHKQYIAKHGEDLPEIRNWKWGGESR